MIDYQTLCQTIVDWREGKKPEAPPPLPGAMVPIEEPPAAAPDYDDFEGPTNYQSYEQLDEVHALDDDGSFEDAPLEVEPELSDYVEPDVALEVEPEIEAAPVAEPEGYVEVDPATEPQIEAASDEFAESTVDKTQAYVPEDYDPAGAKVQQAATDFDATQAQMAVPGEGAEVAEVADEEFEVEAADEEFEVEADGDDFERDYDLEEVDDFASFDPYTDLGGFFKAEAHITAVWEDDDQRRAALAQYGIRDEQHFYQVTSSMERYFISDDAESRYGGLDGIMQLKVDATQEMVREEQQARIEGELSGELEPVHGISLQHWAAAQAQLASGADAATVVAGLGIDDATWQVVSTEWNERMARDTTATIATEYGKAFAAGGAGQFGEAGQAAAEAMDGGTDPAGDPPISMEQWVEIEVAQSVGFEQGHEAADVLAQFGMSPADWGMASAWWSQYFSRHAMENGGALHQHYSQLREHYEAHYRGTAG